MSFRGITSKFTGGRGFSPKTGTLLSAFADISPVRGITRPYNGAPSRRPLRSHCILCVGNGLDRSVKSHQNSRARNARPYGFSFFIYSPPSTNCPAENRFPPHLVEISENCKNGEKTTPKIDKIAKNVEKCGGFVQNSVEKLKKTKNSQFVHKVSTKLPMFFPQNAQKSQKYLGIS